MTLPLIIWLFNPRKLQKFLIVAVIAAPVLRTLLCIGWPGKFMLTFALMPCRADALLLGVLGAIAIRTPAYRAWIEQRGHLILGMIFVLLLGCAVLIHVAASPDSFPMRTLGYSWMAVLYSLILVYSLTQKSSLISKVLRVGLLRSLGKIAYGVYLLHDKIITLVTAVISPAHPFYYSLPALDSWFQFGVTIIALLLTFGLCQLSWMYFEKPLVQIGHRSKYKFDSNPLSPMPTRWSVPDKFGLLVKFVPLLGQYPGCRLSNDRKSLRTSPFTFDSLSHRSQTQIRFSS